MTKQILLSTLGVFLVAENAFADACASSSPEEMGRLYGVDAALVTEEQTYQRKTTSECTWRFQDAAGHGIDIAYRTFDKTEKITNPHFFENNQKFLVSNGRKIGTMDVTYQFEAFPNTTHGILSSAYGNRFTQSLSYVWVEDKQRRHTVTVSSTMNEAGDIKKPTKEDVIKAVSIFTD